MKIVFDTNVLLAGMFTRGVCEGLLDECFGAESHELYTSDAILEEFVRNARAKFRVPTEKLAATVTILRAHMQLVTPAAVDKNECRDPDDLQILGTLLAANAHCLVTGDKDLLVLKRFRGRPIITPRECLQLLSAST